MLADYAKFTPRHQRLVFEGILGDGDGFEFSTAKTWIRLSTGQMKRHTDGSCVVLPMVSLGRLAALERSRNRVKRIIIHICIRACLFQQVFYLEKQEVSENEKIWNWIQVALQPSGTLGGLGGLDGLYALIAFVVVDYIGRTSGNCGEKLSGESGAGYRQKVALFLVVGIGHLLFYLLGGTGAPLHTAIIFFYIANENFSR